MENKRKLRCPFCGHITENGGIGAVYCGPHKVSDIYFPAVRMDEITGGTDENPR